MTTLPNTRPITDIELARTEWEEIANKLESLSDEIRQMPRFKGITPDCQLLADATATILATNAKMIRIDVNWGRMTASPTIL